MSTTTLETRLTRKFVGTYQHLDEWAEVGIVTTLASTTTEPDADSNDPTEPRRTTMLVCVECRDPQPLDRIAQALRDTFSSSGCAHEYDCCGCRSFYVSKAEHLSDARWHVEIGSSRNY